MSTTQVFIVCLALVVVVVVVAVAQWRIRADALAAESARANAAEAALAAARRRIEAQAGAAAASRALGPADGAKVGVHVGSHLIQGTRVRRGEPEADGWIVLDGAELLEGSRSTPLGGRQWLRDVQWLQEL